MARYLKKGLSIFSVSVQKKILGKPLMPGVPFPPLRYETLMSRAIAGGGKLGRSVAL